MADHIEIGDVAPRVQYVADGVQTDFTYPFPIFTADDLEIRLGTTTLVGGYAVSGVGNSTGGTATFGAAPAAGSILTLRRNIAFQRVTDFESNGVLRATTLNDALDYKVAGLQQLQDLLDAALHLDPSENGQKTLLPLRGARAGGLLGFDDLGQPTIYQRGESTLKPAFPGAIPRTVEDKLAETMSARDFGATGDGSTDDGPALQAAMNAAAFAGKHLLIGEGTFRITMPLTLGSGAPGMTMQGVLLYAGPSGHAALTLADGGAAKNAQKAYLGIRVLRETQADWGSEADIGVLLRNLDGSLVEIRQAEGFTIGIRSLGDERGVQECTFLLERIVNNKIGLDIRTASAAGWNTSNRYIGGQFSVGSTLHTDLDRFGVRFSAEPGAYVAHNRHVFEAPAFALAARNLPIAGIPFLSEVSSRAVIAHAIRMEGCSDAVARHTSAAQDHVYEIAWASQGYLLHVDYTNTATRVGAVVRGLHQAAAHREAVRDIAHIPNLRAASIAWPAGQLGFEKLACLSSNVSGTPSTLGDFAFPALDGLTLSDNGVILGGGRGLGFAVDCRRCKEFALAVDADSPRYVVQCFDSAKQLLTSASGALVRASGMSMAYNAGPQWWQGSADATDAALTRLQVLRVEDSVAYALIGIARIDSDYEVRSMRLACDPAFSPPLLYGSPSFAFGSRSLAASQAWDPPAIAAGATAQINIPLTGARPGDFAQAAFSLATSGVVFLAQIGAQDVVTVTAWNRTAASVDLAAGTVSARVVKA